MENHAQARSFVWPQFFAPQAFNGWITTYLKDELHFNTDMMGKLHTALHAGSMTGQLFGGYLQIDMDADLTRLDFAWIFYGGGLRGGLQQCAP